ncbi:hypothetical protein ACLOJK_010267 [Asimina triloba]
MGGFPTNFINRSIASNRFCSFGSSYVDARRFCGIDPHLSPGYVLSVCRFSSEPMKTRADGDSRAQGQHPAIPPYLSTRPPSPPSCGRPAIQLHKVSIPPDLSAHVPLHLLLAGGTAFSGHKGCQISLRMAIPRARSLQVCLLRARNRSAEHLYGYSAAEALGQDAIELLVDAHDFDIASNIINRITMGESWTGQFPVKNKSGDHFFAVATNTPFYDDDGHLVGVICVSSDSRLFQDIRLGTIPSRGSAAATASLRRRRVGDAGATAGSGVNTMVQFYTDDAPQQGKSSEYWNLGGR